MKAVLFLLTAALWAVSFVGGQLMPVLNPAAGIWLVGIPAFAAVLVMPGYLLDRLVGGATDDQAHPLETLARAFAASIGILAVLGLVAHVTRGSLHLVMAELLAVTLILALVAPARRKRITTGWTRASSTLVALIIVVVCVMAAGGENIARDRMWYLAYAARLPLNETLSWSEPFFGGPVWIHRFIANGWILALSAWAELGNLPTPAIFQRVAPVLLSALLVASHLSFSRALFGAGNRAVMGLVCTLAVFFATSFPFMSPTHHAFFDRIAEDKFVALMVLLPVLLAFLLDYMRQADANPLRGLPLLCALAGALALTHALIYLLAILGFLAWWAWALLNRNPLPLLRSALVAIVILGAAAPPAWFGHRAVHQQLRSPAHENIYGQNKTHPIVRAHVRMDRLVEFEPGGPIANPRLIAEPLLALAMLGVLACLTRRREPWSALLVSNALGGMALAYCPWIAPAFGEAVLPWMIYRGLWLVPFGALLAAAVLEGSRAIAPVGASTRGPALLAVLLIVFLSFDKLPVDRLDPRSLWRINTELGFGRDTEELFTELRKLPSWSVIATGSGLSELIPAHTGRHVAAISDRGTVVFAGPRPRSEKRLRAIAAVVGLRGGSLKLRNQLAARYNVTHVVYAGGKCDRKSIEIFSNDSYTLCAEPTRRSRVSRLLRSTATAGSEPSRSKVAAIDDGLSCRPAPDSMDEDSGVRSWRRGSRWSAENVAIDCLATFEEPVNGLKLRVELALPHAHEAVVYRIRTRTSSGTSLKRQGALEFKGNPYGELELPGHWVEKVRVRLAPAYLPYLNVRTLELLGDQTAD